MSDSSWPSYSEEEVEAVSNVLRSGKVNYWTGEEGRQFEQEFAAFCGAEYAVAVANGTVALELALRSVGIGAGDEVVVTSRTFLASASAIVAVGAVPLFSDVDAESQNSTAETIEAVITEKTRAIITVHLAGWPCDMDPILELAKARGITVVEDCAQAHGAQYKGRSVGSIGDVAAWSFCQDKIMSTGGEGGMVTTNSREIWSAAWSYKDHGKSWEATYEKAHPPGFRWLHESFGTNWRMTEMQAAIGRIQLRKMGAWTQQRTENAKRILLLGEQFPKLIRVPRPPQEIIHAWYKCYLFVRPEGVKSGWSRDRIQLEIEQQGVSCLSGSCSEIYLEKAFDHTGYSPEQGLSVARQLGERSLMFQVHPTMAERELDRMVDVIRSVLSEASL